MSLTIDFNAKRLSWPLDRPLDVILPQEFELQLQVQELENEVMTLREENRLLKHQLDCVVSSIKDGRVIVEKKRVLDVKLEEELIKQRQFMNALALEIENCDVFSPPEEDC